MKALRCDVEGGSAKREWETEDFGHDRPNHAALVRAAE